MSGPLERLRDDVRASLRALLGEWADADGSPAATMPEAVARRLGGLAETIGYIDAAIARREERRP